jgi:GDPmannose 4,6-dehydratase
MKKAFITGITGQDGYYLSKYLLDKGYEVAGLIRRSSTFNTSRIDPLISQHPEKIKLYFSDLLDPSSLNNLIMNIQPDEIYNLAAQSHVAVSFKNPMYTISSGNQGTVSLLEALRNSQKEMKYYQASSSEMFGGSKKEMLNENSLFEPKSPYAASKVFSHNMTKLYRDSYDLFAVNGILFNHESPQRGETFVTRKISRAVGRIYHGLQTKLTLGNLDASRDWGYAGDYVEGMWMMLQHDVPDDWVLATGETHTVKEYLTLAFEMLDLDWEKYVLTSEKYFRPNEVDYLLGDSSKARKELGWKPKVSFQELVKKMIEEDLILAEREKVLINNGLLMPTWEHHT